VAAAGVLEADSDGSRGQRRVGLVSLPCFDSDGAMSTFFCFSGGKSETCPPVRLLLHCNERRGVEDAPAVHLFFSYCMSSLKVSYVVSLHLFFCFYFNLRSS
jgi:hypothetical protein